MVSVFALGLNAVSPAGAAPPLRLATANHMELLKRPPDTVTRHQLAVLLARAERATQNALPKGARIRGTAHGFAETTMLKMIRARGTRFVRSDEGEHGIYDHATDRVYKPISAAARYFGVSPAKLAAALQSLGRPNARWMSGPMDTWSVDEVLPSTDPYVRVTRLGMLAPQTTGWTWSRRHGITTWRITGPFPTRTTPGLGTFTATIVLDRHGRVVRDTWTQTFLGHISTLRTAISYGHVATISLPPASLTVDQRELGTALGVAMPVGPIGE